MSDQKTILCAKCEVPLQGPEDAKSDTVLACPNCGLSETIENIMKEIGQRMMVDEVGDMLRNATRGSKHVKYKPGSVHQQPRRFKLSDR